MENQYNNLKIDRRSFLRSTAVTGAGLAISPLVFGQSSGSNAQTDDINVALLGAGVQGQVLMNDCLKIPGIRFKAVCDIWKEYNLKRVSNILNARKHEHNTYQDYQEMLAKEKDLDVVIIATPDFWHSRHTTACLEAGLQVYCETAMSNTLEGAKAMLQTAKKTGKLLQIGHQRRSNARYIHSYNKLIKEANLLSIITSVYGQWNKSTDASKFLPQIEDTEIDTATLKKYEFDSMEQFRNWRWFKGKGGGQVVNLGIHQIDIFNWFLEANPKSVMASGGTDYWSERQLYDNVIAVYEYQTNDGTVRALYRTLTTNDSLGFFEQFLGTEGTLFISENPGCDSLYRQTGIEYNKWKQWVDKGYLVEVLFANEMNIPPDDERLHRTIDFPWEDAPCYTLPQPPLINNTTYYQAHLENFFDAIRGKVRLNCPADVAYKTTVSVLKINDAVETGRKLDFQPQDFEV
jgi:predicted dehydrogenase